LLEAEENIRMV
jgi:hypothetical protein